MTDVHVVASHTAHSLRWLFATRRKSPDNPALRKAGPVSGMVAERAARPAIIVQFEGSSIGSGRADARVRVQAAVSYFRFGPGLLIA